MLCTEEGPGVDHEWIRNVKIREAFLNGNRKYWSIMVSKTIKMISENEINVTMMKKYCILNHR